MRLPCHFQKRDGGRPQPQGDSARRIGEEPQPQRRRPLEGHEEVGEAYQGEAARQT